MIPNRTQQIHNIIEYIKHSGISFSCRDVIENIQHILDRVGMINKYSETDYKIFREELLKIASEAATREISYLIRNHPAPVLKAISLNNHSKSKTIQLVQTQRR